MGFFLLQHSITEVMTEAFAIIKRWLVEHTIVETFMSDYQTSARTAIRTVFPNIKKIIGCEIHFIRALGVYAIRRSIYRDPMHSASRRMMDKAYGLCLFPADFTSNAIDCLETEVPASGPDHKFGVDFIKYLRTVWLPKGIR